MWAEQVFSKDCQNSISQAIILDIDYSLVLLCATSFCLIMWNLWKVWTQESFQKVKFDRPGERSPG